MLGAEVYPVAGMISNIISFVDELQEVLLRFTLVHTQLSHSTTLKTTIIVCSFFFFLFLSWGRILIEVTFAISIFAEAARHAARLKNAVWTNQVGCLSLWRGIPLSNDTDVGVDVLV